MIAIEALRAYFFYVSEYTQIPFSASSKLANKALRAYKFAHPNTRKCK